MFFMQKLIEILISYNLKLIESGILKSVVLDNGVVITFESTKDGIKTTAESKSDDKYVPPLQSEATHQSVYKIYFRRYWEEEHRWNCLVGFYEELFLDELKMLKRYIELRDNKYIGNIEVLKSNAIEYSEYNIESKI